MNSQEINTNLEAQNNSVIPKSREIYIGDINDAVIKVQEITGFEITPEWWSENVGNEGATEDILDRFDIAFAEFVLHQGGADSLNSEHQVVDRYKAEVINEAEKELEEFDKTIGDDSEPSRSEFIEALTDHLKEKYFPEDDAQKLEFESTRYNQIFEKHPESEQRIEFSAAGIEVVSCGRELSDHETAVIRSAIGKISGKIGESETESLFGGVRLYAGDGLIEGGGLALPRFNSMAIDLEKIGVTISQMENMLGETGEYKIGDQSKLVDDPNEHEALELAIVHEFGHILEHKTYGDVDRGFAEVDQSDAPTEYGSKSPREDYAESFMYYIYGGRLDSARLGILVNNIMARH
jgi:hypothetical protein